MCVLCVCVCVWYTRWIFMRASQKTDKGTNHHSLVHRHVLCRAVCCVA